MIALGNWNVFTGNNSTNDDGVCGQYGQEIGNEAGRTLRTMASMNELVDLVTWENHVIPSTYYDIKSGHGQQLNPNIHEYKRQAYGHKLFKH